MKVKIKPTSEKFKSPIYATPGSACFDLFSTEKITILPGFTASVDLGFKIEMEPGFYLDIRPRSGMSVKKGMLIPNSPGTVDSDYRGNVQVALLNTTNKNFTIEEGDRVCQGMIKQYETTEFEIVEELSDTVRGEGGYGSTGMK